MEYLFSDRRFYKPRIRPTETVWVCFTDVHGLSYVQQSSKPVTKLQTVCVESGNTYRIAECHSPATSKVLHPDRLKKIPFVHGWIDYEVDLNAWKSAYTPLRVYDMRQNLDSPTALVPVYSQGDAFGEIWKHFDSIETLRRIVYSFDEILRIACSVKDFEFYTAGPDSYRDRQHVTFESLDGFLMCLIETPETFCFSSVYLTSSGEWKRKALMRQLSEAEYVAIKRAFRATPNDDMCYAIRVFHVLQNAYLRDKHFYLSDEQLRTRTSLDMPVLKHTLSRLIGWARVVNRDGNLYCLREMSEMEYCVQDGLSRLKNFAGPLSRHDESNTRTLIEFDADVCASLHPEQQRAYRHFHDHPLTVLIGGGGSGKTLTVSKIISAYTNEAFTVLVLSFQAKNVNDIRAACTQTIGMSPNALANLYFMTAHKFIKIYQTGTLRGAPIKARQTADYDMVVIEEASMMSTELFAGVLATVARDLGPSVSPLSRIVILGDTMQLPPIQPGQLLTDIVTGLPNDVFHLTVNHRANTTINDNLLQPIRARKPEEIQFDADIVVHHAECNLETVSEKLDELFKQYNLNHRTTQVISRTHEISDRINQSHGVLSGYGLLRPGQKVVFKANLPGTEVYTNAIHFISEIHLVTVGVLKTSSVMETVEPVESEIGPPLRMDSRGDPTRMELREILSDNVSVRELLTGRKRFSKTHRKEQYIELVLQPMDHPRDRVFLKWKKKYFRYMHPAYCCTIHASQGSQYENVVYVLSKFSPYETRNVAYTAFSRAKSRVFFLGYRHFLDQAIQRDEPYRATRLALSLRAIQSDETTTNDEIVYANVQSTGVPQLAEGTQTGWHELPSGVLSDIFEYTASAISCAATLAFEYTQQCTFRTLEWFRCLFKLRSVCQRWKWTIETSYQLWRAFIPRELTQRRAVGESILHVLFADHCSSVRTLSGSNFLRDGTDNPLVVYGSHAHLFGRLQSESYRNLLEQHKLLRSKNISNAFFNSNEHALSGASNKRARPAARPYLLCVYLRLPFFGIGHGVADVVMRFEGSQRDELSLATLVDVDIQRRGGLCAQMKFAQPTARALLDHMERELIINEQCSDSDDESE